MLERLEQSRFDVFAHRPSLGVGDALVIAWRTLTSCRDTSFSYSFLVLPPNASAIVTVWDFCRAVDDAVDEAPDPAAGRPPAGVVA